MPFNRVLFASSTKTANLHRRLVGRSYPIGRFSRPVVYKAVYRMVTTGSKSLTVLAR